MSRKVMITAAAGAILLGTTVLASAQHQAFPQDRYYGGYGYYGAPPGYYGYAPGLYGSTSGLYGYAPGYYGYAPGYYGYAPGYYSPDNWAW
jgi:hypothetical protein